MQPWRIEPVIIKPQFPALSKAGRWLVLRCVPWFFGPFLTLDKLGLIGRDVASGSTLAGDRRRRGADIRSGTPSMARTPPRLEGVASSNRAPTRDRSGRHRPSTVASGRSALPIRSGADSTPVWRARYGYGADLLGQDGVLGEARRRRWPGSGAGGSPRPSRPSSFGRDQIGIGSAERRGRATERVCVTRAGRFLAVDGSMGSPSAFDKRWCRRTRCSRRHRRDCGACTERADGVAKCSE